RSRLTLPLGMVRHDPIVGTQNNEDERRLFYVALTRAKERVYLSYARHTAKDRERTASLFWHELPPECVVDAATLETQPAALQRLTVMRRARPAGHGSAVQDWLRRRLKTYVLSVTHLNNYLTCPRLWLYRNVVLVPAAKTRSLALGTAVHSSLKDLMVRAAREGALPGVAWLLERFQAHLKLEILTAADFRDSRAQGQSALRAYYAQYKQTWVRHVLTEYSFRSHGVHIGAARITGTLDKVEIIDAKQKLVNVVDYKTGNPDSAGPRVKAGGQYRRQLVFYQLLCDSSPRFPYRMVSGELDFVQPSARTGKFVKRRLAISSGETAELADVITKAWEDITALAFLKQPGCGECEYCKAVN
ncbi:MAG: PD-(D/E)XK nuclease family protein, partial [Candidatus Andersenbacteria bacterium]|nr:PD-(D/E)XK nuclease family protein [Candidatus Andersenbacteria bacterium]